MERLKRIATYLSPYTHIADVGCDHGYLIIEAYKLREDFKFIAIDNKKGPLESCIANISPKPYFDKVRFSLSSGIKDIDDKTEVVVLAGMGGMLVCDILKDNLRNVERIITCANRDNYEVRKFISSIGYKISNEEIIYDKNKYYQLIVFDKCNCYQSYSEIELTYGPKLLSKKDKLFIDYLTNELEQLEKIPVQTEKKLNKINVIKGILYDCK